MTAMRNSEARSVSVRSSRDVLPAPGELMRFRARMPCLANCSFRLAASFPLASRTLRITGISTISSFIPPRYAGRTARGPFPLNARIARRRWTRRKEMLSLDGRESMSALGTLESDGNLFGFQHSAFEVGSAVSASKAKESFRDDVGECSISYPYQQQTMDVMLSISSRTMDNRLVTTDISCMAELLWLIPGTRLGSFWTEAQGRSVGEKEW